MLRTQEQLLKLFKDSREKQNKKKEEEKLKYKKASESIKKERAYKLSIKDKQTQQEPRKQTLQRSMPIYNTRYIERFIDENEVYTKEELFNGIDGGRINIVKYNELVQQTKQEIANI